jgi:hypothetical protein
VVSHLPFEPIVLGDGAPGVFGAAADDLLVLLAGHLVTRGRQQHVDGLEIGGLAIGYDAVHVEDDARWG